MLDELVELLKQSNVDDAKKLLEKHPHLLMQKDSHGRSLLHLACVIGSLPFVKHLVQISSRTEEGLPILDISCRDDQRKTPLHLAMENCQFKICEYLLKETNCTVNGYDVKSRNTVLHYLALCNDITDSDKIEELIGLLYEHGADINARNINLETPLYLSCARGLESMATWLLSYRMNINCVNIEGKSPLHGAIESGNGVIIKKLLDLRANTSLLCQDDLISQKMEEKDINRIFTDYDEYRLFNDEEPYTSSIESFAYINSPEAFSKHKRIDELGNPWGRTILHQAVLHGSVKDVKWILEDKSLTIIHDKDQPKGWTAIMHAAAFGYLLITRLLIANGADPCFIDSDGSGILHFLARNYIGNVNDFRDLFEMILDSNVDTNMKNDYGNTALHEAALRNNFIMVDELLKANADCNVVNNDGDTPLIFSTMEGHLEASKLLLDANADISIKGKHGTALEVSRLSNSIELIKAFKFLDLDKDVVPLEEVINESPEESTLPSDLDQISVEESADESETTNDFLRNALLESFGLHYRTLFKRATLNKLKEVFKSDTLPLIAYKCACSAITKVKITAKECILAIWRDYICIYSPLEEDFFYRMSLKESGLEGYLSSILFLSKIVLKQPDLKLVISSFDELSRCYNLLDHLKKLPEDQPFALENMIAVQYQKELSELVSHTELQDGEYLVLPLNILLGSKNIIYLTNQRIVFGKKPYTSISYEDLRSINLTKDMSIEIMTYKVQYVFSCVKSDVMFQLIEHLWNKKQNNSRILLFASKGKRSQQCARMFLEDLSKKMDVYLKWMHLKELNAKPNRQKKTDLGYNIVYTSKQKVSKCVARMRKLTLLYFDDDPDFLQSIQDIINACAEEPYFRYIMLVTLSVDVKQRKYHDSIVKLKGIIEQSKIPFVYINSSTAFMQVFLDPYVNIKYDWVFQFPLGDKKISWMDMRDLSSLLKTIILEKEDIHSWKSYSLGGPDAYTCSEIATIMSETLNQDIRYKNIPWSTFKTQVRSALKTSEGVDVKKQDMEEDIALFETLLSNSMETDASNIKEILNISPHPLQDFVLQHKNDLKDDSVTSFSFYQHDALESLFLEISNPSKMIDLNGFRGSLGGLFTSTMKSLSTRFFSLFDRKKSGKISMLDYFSVLSAMVSRSLNDQTELASLFLDLDEDGIVTKTDVIGSMEQIIKILQEVISEESVSPLQSLVLKLKESENVPISNLQNVLLMIRTLEFRDTEAIPKDLCSNAYSKTPGIPISPGHPQWDMLLRVSLGISKLHCFLKQNENPETLKKTLTLDVMSKDEADKWVLNVCNPYIFDKIRNLFGFSTQDHLDSLGFESILLDLMTGKLSTFWELSSSGRSGSFIWKTHDEKLLLKTLPVEEYHFLKKNAHRYYLHYQKYMNTLISRFYGLYKLISPKGEYHYFVIMPNLFDTGYAISEQYDLKGSTHSRKVGWKDWIPSRALKDLDFNRRICVGPRIKTMILEQAEIDAIWMESMNICDYSLLVGIHYIDEGESIPISKDRSEFRRYDGGLKCMSSDEYDASNQILYFCGIIDVLTEFNLKKKGESAWKHIVHQGQISAAPPKRYRKRFLRYLCTILD